MKMRAFESGVVAELQAAAGHMEREHNMELAGKERFEMDDLMKIIRLLRRPVGGCPWDSVQTHQSIRMNFLEETCEVLEAIDLADSTLLCEELGDILMQVALHTAMEEEQGRFTLEDVCTGVCRKLIYRHPHVFAGKAAPGPSTWDELKNQEKGRASLTDELESVPATLPALMRAGKTLKRAARYGFGPADEAAARREAQAQLQQLLAGDKGTSAEREAQVGDALLALTAYCRLAGVDPELALTRATQRFVKQAEKTAPSTEQTLCADRNLEVRKNDES